jgi:hypothetical protein
MSCPLPPPPTELLPPAGADWMLSMDRPVVWGPMAPPPYDDDGAPSCELRAFRLRADCAPLPPLAGLCLELRLVDLRSAWEARRCRDLPSGWSSPLPLVPTDMESLPPPTATPPELPLWFRSTFWVRVNRARSASVAGRLTAGIADASALSRGWQFRQRPDSTLP